MAVPLILLDAHVHIYPCYDLAVLLRASYDNFQRQAGHLQGGTAFVPVLMLTEAGAAQWFRELRAAAGEGRTDLAGPAWRLQAAVDDDAALYARGTQGEELLIVAGRQIVTRERLEVLALASAAQFADGLSLPDTLDRVQAAGAIAVLPWGVGKWLGQRGKLVAQALEARGPGLFVGDIGGRPRWSPYPRLLALAARLGLGLLSGTDPLPLPREARRPGSFGSCLRCAWDRARPAAALRAALQSGTTTVRGFGRGAGLYEFVRNQAALRWAKQS